MTNWMVRGLAFAAAMVVVRLLQGALINAWQTEAGLISIVLLAIFIVGPIVWGVLDGRADATETPDPDRRKDLAMTWLLAGLSAGVLSGTVCWLIATFYKGLYTGGLVSELTTFAAFTALIIFVLALIGVATGRWVVDRKSDKAPRKHHGLAAEHDRADTDVFEAVHADGGAGGGEAQAEQRTAAIATAERDEPTEAIPTTRGDAPTEVIRTDAAQTKPTDEGQR